MTTLSWVVLLPQLCYIAINDVRVWKITNRSNLLLALSFFVHIAVGGDVDALLPNLLTAAGAVLVLYLPYQRGWLGGGDVKFLIAAHLWLGPFRLMPFSLALFAGLLVYYILMKLALVPVEAVGRQNRIPFGPVGAFALAASLLIDSSPLP